MKKSILILAAAIFLFTTVSGQVRTDSIRILQRKIEKLEKTNSKLSTQVVTANTNIKNLETKLTSTVDSVDALKKQLTLTAENMEAMSAKLEKQLQRVADKSNADIAQLAKKVSNNSVYWIIALVAVILIPAIIFGLLRSRLTHVKTELSDQIKTSSETIREEIIKLDNQVFWSLDFQKKMNKQDVDGDPGIDHALVLKVADEIVRIQKNLHNLDQETKGVKQLEFAVERIQDNFKENGYEIVDLLNKPYDQRMKLSAKFRTDAALKRGEQVITRIIKPQVNYNDEIIQEAQVEVSVGEYEGSG